MTKTRKTPETGIDAVLAAHGRDPGRLVQILRDVQALSGWISPADIAATAAAAADALR